MVELGLGDLLSIEQACLVNETYYENKIKISNEFGKILIRFYQTLRVFTEAEPLISNNRSLYAGLPSIILYL